MFERCLADVFGAKRSLDVEVALPILRWFCSVGAQSIHLLRHGRRVFRKTHFGEVTLVGTQPRRCGTASKRGDLDLFRAVFDDVRAMFGGRATLHVGTDAGPGELVLMFGRCSAMFDRCSGVFRGKMPLKQPHLMPVKGLAPPQIDCHRPHSVVVRCLCGPLLDCFVLIRFKAPCLRCR